MAAGESRVRHLVNHLSSYSENELKKESNSLKKFVGRASNDFTLINIIAASINLGVFESIPKNDEYISVKKLSITLNLNETKLLRILQYLNCFGYTKIKNECEFSHNIKSLFLCKDTPNNQIDFIQYITNSKLMGCQFDSISIQKMLCDVQKNQSSFEYYNNNHNETFFEFLNNKNNNSESQIFNDYISGLHDDTIFSSEIIKLCNFNKYNIIADIGCGRGDLLFQIMINNNN
eukprot:57918_1